MKKLSEAEVSAAVAALPGWSVKDAKLHREYKFRDFKNALQFMTGAVPGIEQMDHHPEWANVYNRVNVDLTTHSAGGITQKDFDLAALLEELSAKFL